jgi:phytoene/squalene synthetase
MAETFDNLLKATSRSFYQPFRVLPARVRPQTGNRRHCA